MELSKNDQLFLKYIRSISIIIIVFGHVGGFWFFNPYSSFLLTVIPVFFFISGSVAFYSYERTESKILYLKKRCISLLTPYYLVCIIAIAFALITGATIKYDLVSLIKWVTMTPVGEGICLGQVWFLRVLLMLTLVSPILFEIHKRNDWFILLVMFLSASLAVVQSITNVGGFLAIFDERLFISCIMGIYYIFGFYYFSNKKKLTKKKLLYLLALSLLVLIGFIGLTNIEVSLRKHEYYPDLYYLSAGFAAIFTILINKKMILLFQKISIIDNVLDFFHKHTLSVFLLHGFGITVADKLFGVALPLMYEQHNIKYGLIMFLFTMIVTCVAAIPFTAINSKCKEFILPLFLPAK